jgi:hypothetical protein
VSQLGQMLAHTQAGSPAPGAPTEHAAGIIYDDDTATIGTPSTDGGSPVLADIVSDTRGVRDGPAAGAPAAATSVDELAGGAPARQVSGRVHIECGRFDWDLPICCVFLSMK